MQLLRHRVLLTGCLRAVVTKEISSRAFFSCQAKKICADCSIERLAWAASRNYDCEQKRLFISVTCFWLGICARMG